MMSDPVDTTSFGCGEKSASAGVSDRARVLAVASATSAAPTVLRRLSMNMPFFSNSPEIMIKGNLEVSRLAAADPGK